MIKAEALFKLSTGIKKPTKDKEDNEEVSEEEEEKAGGDMLSMANVVVRPPTPEFSEIRTQLASDPDVGKNENERHNLINQRLEQKIEHEKAIILLQRLLRGRAYQNMMFEGKEKRLDLIAELRITEEWKQSSDQDEKNIIQNYQERVLDGVAEGLQAEIIAETLSNLSNELVRFKQERRIAAMVHLAEQDRRRREAEESGRRQAEIILGEREDTLYYDELLAVHQGSVDNYLQNIFTNAIDNASATQAYKEAKLKVQRLNKIIDRAEDKKHNKPRHIVKDLMTSFLIPDVQRKKLQRQV